MKFLILVAAGLSACLAASNEKKVDKRGLSPLHDLRAGLTYAPSAPVFDYGTSFGESVNDAQIVASRVPNLHSGDLGYAPSFGYSQSLPFGEIGHLTVGPHVSPGYASHLGGLLQTPFRYVGIASGLPTTLQRIHGGNIVSQHVTVTNRVAVPVVQPYPVPIERPISVPVPTPVRIPVDRPFPVPVPDRVPVPVDRPFAVPVDRPIPVPVAHPFPVPFSRPVALSVTQPLPVTNVLTVPASYQLPIQHPFLSSSPALFHAGHYRPSIQHTNFINGPAFANGIPSDGYFSQIPYPSRTFPDGPRYPIGGVSLGGSLSFGPFGQISKQLNLGLRK